MTPPSRPHLALVFVLGAGCDDGTVAAYPPCVIDSPVVTPASAAPGDPVSLTLTPVSTSWDTLVLFGDQRASVKDVTRTDCDSCDSCRENQGCSVCDSCPDCEASCESCVGAVEVVVPNVDAGSVPVIVMSYYGSSAPAEFLVVGGGDSGDTGP